MVIVFKTVREEWKDVKNQVKKKFDNLPKKKQEQLKADKFVSFFRHTVLPKNYVTKFPYVIENTKREYLTGKFRYFLSPKNKVVIKILMRGFFVIFLALLYAYRFFDDLKKLKMPQLHDITIFNYFNNNYFNNYYFSNKWLQTIIKSYYLDSNYNDNYINTYNFYILHHLKLLNVILNFEDFKYEEDQYWLLNNPKMLHVKNKKGWKMKTDYFYYIKRKNRFRLFNKYIKFWPWYRDASWNQIEQGDDDEYNIKIKKENKILKDHLMLQDNIFYCFIVYEFSFNLNNNILFNYFNVDFFNKVKIFLKKPKKKIFKFPYFLKSTYYNFNLDLLNLKKKKFIYTDYKNINKNYNNKDFNYKKHILDIKFFGIKMPYLIFLLYTWYSIFFRRCKYNLYIRGEDFFQEHFSKLYIFLWSNNGGKVGYNKYKLSTYKYQKLFTIYNLKSYVEVGLFNNWFFFYYSYHIKFKQYIDLNEYQHKSSFLLLLNNPYILNIINVKVENKVYYINLFYEYFLTSHYWYELWNGYTLFINTPVTKFENDFKLGRLSYWKFDLMVERVFTIPLDKKRLLKYLQVKVLFEHFFNIYIKFNYFNIYFLKDLYNIKLLSDYKKHVKIINFYDKIFYIIFLLIDPFFFKYYWKRCFPRKWYKIHYIQHYILANILMVKFKVYMVKFNIPKYSFLMNFFYWRIDTSNYCTINDHKSLKMCHNFIVINSIYKTRFIELLKQINFVLKKKYLINLKYFFSYYLAVLKNYYFELLYYNFEYSMIYFFLNKKKYINLLYNYNSNFFKDFLYSNFIYRYYIYNILLDTHYYSDWFYDLDKRIYWIYKNFLDHEGPLFYKKKTLVV